MRPCLNYGEIAVYRKKPAGALAVALIAAEICFCYEHANITGYHIFTIPDKSSAVRAYKLTTLILRKEEFETA